MLKWALWASLAVVLIVVGAAFCVGPLFPWSPLKPGYTHFTLHRADIYYPAGTTLDESYKQLDSFIEQAEKFHDLKMPDRITVIAPRTWSGFHLQAPWQRGPVAGLTLQTGTVIFITPRVGEKRLDTAEFLKHELSHAILDQNMTLWRGHKFSRQSWLSEGLAVDFAQQKAYLTQDEFMAQAQTRPLAPSFNGDDSDTRFNYVVWRYFVDYLRRTQGKDKFQNYLLRVMQEPDQAQGVFPEYFGVSFDDALRLFQAQLRGGHLL